jgi:hypothetical protein
MNALIQYVVVDENTLGYIDPASPTMVGVLLCSGLKSGSSGGHHNSPFALLPYYKVRPATQQDFDNFNVSSIGHFPVN